MSLRRIISDNSFQRATEMTFILSDKNLLADNQHKTKASEVGETNLFSTSRTSYPSHAYAKIAGNFPHIALCSSVMRFSKSE